MFDTYATPSRTLNQSVPEDWPVLLEPAPGPSAADPCSTRRREAHVAMSGGKWREAVVWAWSWNATGRPVRWQVQIQIGDHIRWYWYRAGLLQTHPS
jgi:hypothetical protein